jgi:hypothetical protein
VKTKWVLYPRVFQLFIYSYSKLVRCWEFEPTARPSFLEMKEYFYGILKTHNQIPKEETD